MYICPLQQDESSSSLYCYLGNIDGYTQIELFTIVGPDTSE